MSDISVHPYWIPDRQNWATDHLQTSHTQALYARGEFTAFALMWREPDFEAGLVSRCSTCYVPYGAIADTFKQPALEKCPNCFGTTFEGGYKAILIRPALWDFSEQENAPSPRGETVTSRASIQSTADFRARRGDYAFRADGNRYRIAGETATRIRTGFTPVPTGLDVAIGFTYDAGLEDPSSVAYMIPPLNATLMPALNQSYPRYPPDFSALETARGPLT